MNTVQSSGIRGNPWLWVPTLFFMQGFPGVLIMGVIGLMYNNFDIPVAQITFYTGIMVLPWTIRPLWASFIDIFFTKRAWIVSMQLIMGVCFVALGLSMQAQHYFVLSVAVGIFAGFIAATHDIASDGMYVLMLRDDQQSFFLGIQSSAYSIGKMMASGAIVMFSGYLYNIYKQYHSAWEYAMMLAGVICILFGVYHAIMLPRERNKHGAKHTIKNIFVDYIIVFREFLKIEKLLLVVLFMFFYRIGQVFLETMLPIFMTSPLNTGGLGLSNEFTGFAYGVVASIAIVFGGLTGGWVIYRRGISNSIWMMFVSMNITHLLYIVLAYFQITNQVIVTGVIVVEQFTSSFAFAAYYLILMYCVRDSEYKTAHFAFFNALMMLTIMLPKMFCGWIQEMLGYSGFFEFVILMIIPGIFVVRALKIDPLYGKHQKLI